MTTRLKTLAGLAMSLGLLLAPPLSGNALAQSDEAADDTAEGLSISVLSVQTDDAFNQAEALTKALRVAVRDAEGWSLDEQEHSLEVVALSISCDVPPDPRCQTKIADKIGADRYLWGQLKVEGPNVGGQLNFWTRGKGTVTTELRYSANLTEAADESLKAVVNEAIDKVTGGPPEGRVAIRAGTIDGQVFIDDKNVGPLVSGQGVFALKAGEHEIEIRSAGYKKLTAQVIVRPNGTERLVLTPVVDETRGGADWQKIGGFIGVGMGVAFGAVGVVSTLQVNSARNDESFEAFRQQYPGVDDVCEAAEAGDPALSAQSGAYTREEAIDVCNKAGTFEVMQAVFYPLAAISGGIGLVLLGTADWSDEEGKGETAGGLHIGPRVGPRGGRLDVSYTW